ncbi:hypothetical protein E3P99_01583 [Wallemia hederae]|uniref:DinB-like domain-containing protein n=1 Tax=Wallemia hederae TaxID=1540922 RepID=A0A4T0FR50_9BASI|nr:hypothetical protein E3P99_01583 [Wallemia hederae]
MHALLDIAVRVLAQLEGVLNGIDASQYTRISAQPPHSSISKHVRHLLDRFEMVLGALSRPYDPSRPLDLDNVPKDRAVQFDLDAAKRKLGALIRETESIAERERSGGDSVLQRSTSVAIHAHADIAGDAPVIVNSTLARELHFVIVHAIHHYALIRVIVEGEMGIAVSEEFGRGWTTQRRDSKL